MEIKVNFLDKLRLEAKFDDFTVIADQPIRYKGDGSAPGPFDYFLASSALCAAYFVKLYCDTRNISTEHIPYKYLPAWVIISTPILHTIFFLLGFFFISKRFIIKFLEIENIQKNKDLWFSFNEKKDFLMLFTLSAIFIFVVIRFKFFRIFQ